MGRCGNRARPIRPQAAKTFLADNPDIEIVEVLLVDLNGVLRGKWIPRDAFPSVLEHRLKLPLTVVTPDVWGRDVPERCHHTGDGDGIVIPELRTLKRMPWLARPTAQVLCHREDEGKPWGSTRASCCAMLKPASNRGD